MPYPPVWFKRSAPVPAIELRRNWRTSNCYELHTHAEYSIGLVDEGEASYQLGKTQHAITTGDLVTIDANAVHACNPHSEHWSYRMLFIEPAYLNELFAQSDKPLKVAQAYQRQPNLSATFDELFTSLVEDEPALVVESQLVALCTPLWKPLEQTPQVIELAGLQRVKALLQEQSEQDFSLQVLSQIAGLNSYQLVRHFKKVYGLPPHAFQLDTRIQRAKPLLRQGVSLSQVALDLGFADQAHFQRHFKKRLALTPKSYQQHFIK